jgi:hypothetical protein
MELKTRPGGDEGTHTMNSTVLSRRVKPECRSWRAIKQGFGSGSGEEWSGKAAINRTQSRRFALAVPHQTSRQRLDCVCLSTALRRTAMMPCFQTAAIPVSEFGLNFGDEPGTLCRAYFRCPLGTRSRRRFNKIIRSYTGLIQSTAPAASFTASSV